MRQVPHYLIIGNGRVATHMVCYLAMLQLPYSHWHREQALSLLTHKLSQATHILLLISDQAIESFVTTHLTNVTARLIHFSGSFVSQSVIGAHPLMTFSNTLYTRAEYEAIPFIIDDHAPLFSDLLPGFPNTHARLPSHEKANYHALCVLSGNFSCLLWNKLFQSLETKWKIPAALAHPYLKQQIKNILAEGEAALTGPLVRNDVVTLQKNIAALTGDPFQAVYESFVACYARVEKEGSHEHT